MLSESNFNKQIRIRYWLINILREIKEKKVWIRTQVLRPNWQLYNDGKKNISRTQTNSIFLRMIKSFVYYSQNVMLCTYLPTTRNCYIAACILHIYNKICSFLEVIISSVPTVKISPSRYFIKCRFISCPYQIYLYHCYC